ncbi:hypothetical protein DRE_05999 [Drechslerella stenobrocha 248]|uniref:DNA mismatch repair protein S5 domain-containing protein n=1 Tax=Drechslerella stenobrocha 248 TaxID=1043628 RepID=W7HYL5_9PEZI|nr:hypothetical protein DRE_05999 [Drechslerella stenobrocha 248]
MTIHEIPLESVRRLGSTQELVENALDATATSIVIEASPDLVSHIQVKDNGYGINPSDRPLMARQHCTSKLTSFDDLVEGVTTLGFRGEALASLAAVSGGFTITTRVRSETIAVACEIACDGSLKAITPVSAPIGCTIRIVDLFANFPVRKTSLEKGAAKYLAQIRPLLLSYYLTHPETRFQFKLVAPPQANKGKKKIDTKFDIIYAASSTKEQAVIKAFGAESSRNGQWVKHGDEASEAGVEIFCVKPDADSASVSKKGVCLAYQNRPLSITRSRGLAHSIYGAYKKRVKAAFAARSAAAPTEPFLFLNIVSSVGKVDVNIEPAKDDVLFENTEKMMSYLEDCFEHVYSDAAGDKQSGDDTIRGNTNGSEMAEEFTSRQVLPRALILGTVSTAGRHQVLENRPRELASSPPIKIISHAPIVDTTRKTLAGKESLNGSDRSDNLRQDKPSPYPDQAGCDSTSPSPSQQEQPKGSDWSFNMYGSGVDVDDDEFVDIEDALRESERREAARDEDIRGDASIANPWTISKMNARVSNQSQLQASDPIPISANTVNTPKGLEAHQQSRVVESRSPTAIQPDTPPTSMSMSSAPITRMPGNDRSWFPRFGSNSGKSSPNGRHPGDSRSQPRTLSEDTSLSTRIRRIRSVKNTRSQAGPIDSWVSSSRSHEVDTAEDEVDELQTHSPPTVFFGKPDLRTSAGRGDGGRGLFHSAADRVRQRDRLRAQMDELEEDDVSFSEDDEPYNGNYLPQNGHSNTKPTTIGLPLDQGSLKLPKGPTESKALTSAKNREGGNIAVTPAFLAAAVPHIDLQRLRFRSHLVEESFYDDEYDSRGADISNSEFKTLFFSFVRRYIASANYGDDAALELLQRDLIGQKEFNVTFRNLADT